MIHSLKTIITGIKNIWRWRKIIYKDRDWDHYYIYEILKTKLKHQAEYFHKHGMCEKDEYDSKIMIQCIDLIEKVQNEVYIDEALQKMDPDKWDPDIARLAEINHERAKKQVFELIEKNIDRWWT